MKKIVLVAFLMLSQMNFAQDKSVKLGDFDQVKVFDRISVLLVEGNENKIEITGKRKYDVEIVNKNGELKVRMKLGKLLKGDDISATIYFTKEINSVEASEGSFVSSEATFKAIDFLASAKEGAEVKLNLDVKKLKVKGEEKGYTIVPLRIFTNERGYAKIEIALAQGKKEFDKRDSIKEREGKREMDRAMKI